MYLLNAVLFAACSMIWVINGARDGDVLDYIIAVIWAAGCIINLMRHRKNKKQNGEETK